ncbi:MAG: nuclear transport factor 2 family protein [Actinomycetes bacterium]
MSSPAGSPSPTAGPSTAVVPSAAEVVERFNAVWSAHDLAGALALLRDDCVFDATSPAPDGTSYRGRAEIESAWQPIFDDRDSRFTVEQFWCAGDRVVQQWRYDWNGGHVRGVDLFTVTDGLITAKSAYVKG